MYAVAGDCPGNEELALQIQTGDRSAAELLVARNEGYLTDLAKGHTAWCELEDLKQKVTLKLYEKKKSSIVSQTVNETMIKIEADKILKASPQYLAKKADLESQDEVIRFIGEAKQIISQFGFDIKNSIDVLKLEQI